MLEGEKLHKVHSHLRRLTLKSNSYESHDAKVDELKKFVERGGTRRQKFQPSESSSPSEKRQDDVDSDDQPLLGASGGGRASTAASPAGGPVPPEALAQPAAASVDAGDLDGGEDAAEALRSFRRVCEQLELDPGSGDEDADVAAAVRRVLQKIPEPTRPAYAKQIFDLLEARVRKRSRRPPARLATHARAPVRALPCQPPPLQEEQAPLNTLVGPQAPMKRPAAAPGSASGVRKRPAADPPGPDVERLRSLGVPPQLWPTERALCKGRHSYTAHDPEDAGVRVEVLLRSQSYYVRAVHPSKAAPRVRSACTAAGCCMVRARSGHVRARACGAGTHAGLGLHAASTREADEWEASQLSRTVSWRRLGGAEAAWAKLAPRIGWGLPHAGAA